MVAKKKVIKKKSVAKKKVAATKKVVKNKVVKKQVVQAPAIKAIAKKQTKSDIIATISEKTNLSKKDVDAVFSNLADLVTAHMKKRGSGEFTIPDVGVKIRRFKKPATKARKGVNPATGEAITIKAKAAHNAIKVSALKGLKDSVLL